MPLAIESGSANASPDGTVESVYQAADERLIRARRHVAHEVRRASGPLGFGVRVTPTA